MTEDYDERLSTLASADDQVSELARMLEGAVNGGTAQDPWGHDVSMDPKALLEALEDLSGALALAMPAITELDVRAFEETRSPTDLTRYFKTLLPEQRHGIKADAARTLRERARISAGTSPAVIEALARATEWEEAAWRRRAARLEPYETRGRRWWTHFALPGRGRECRGKGAVSVDLAYGDIGVEVQVHGIALGKPDVERLSTLVRRAMLKADLAMPVARVIVHVASDKDLGLLQEEVPVAAAAAALHLAVVTRQAYGLEPEALGRMLVACHVDSDGSLAVDGKSRYLESVRVLATEIDMVPLAPAGRDAGAGRGPHDLRSLAKEACVAGESEADDVERSSDMEDADVGGVGLEDLRGRYVELLRQGREADDALEEVMDYLMSNETTVNVLLDAGLLRDAVDAVHDEFCDAIASCDQLWVWGPPDPQGLERAKEALRGIQYAYNEARTEWNWDEYDAVDYALERADGRETMLAVWGAGLLQDAADHLYEDTKAAICNNVLSVEDVSQNAGHARHPRQ